MMGNEVLYLYRYHFEGTGVGTSIVIFSTIPVLKVNPVDMQGKFPRQNIFFNKLFKIINFF